MPTRPTPRPLRRSIARWMSVVVGVLLAVLSGLVPSVVGPVSAATPPSAAGCVLPDDGSMGRLDFDTFRRPVGTVRAVMLFVDFPDVPAAGSADTIYEDLFAPAPAWLAQSSAGKLDLQITPVRHWIRMPEALATFKPVNGALMGDEGKRYFADAIAAADAEVDFSQVQIVYLVPPAEATAYPRSSGGVWNPDEGVIADGHVLRAVVTFGSSVYSRGYKVLDHETSHLFGPRDYYNTQGTPTDRFVGAWDLMGDPVAGGDHVAWDKWRMGWLTDAQIRCVTAASRAEYVLSPVETRGGVKAVVLRTGLKSAIVVEYRTRTGVDAAMCASGVLVYKVNSALGGGAGPLRLADARPRSARRGRCGGELDDAAFGRGGRWTDTTSGIAVDVLALGSGARIGVTRTKTYQPPPSVARTLASNVVPNADGTATLTAALAAADGLPVCSAKRLVMLQQFRAGEWWTLRAANTDPLGGWTWTWQPEAGATYRLVAPQRVTAAAECQVVRSLALTVGTA